MTAALLIHAHWGAMMATSKTPKWKVLAIDPGPQKSGYVIWDGQTILGKGIVSNLELRIPARVLRNATLVGDWWEAGIRVAIEFPQCFGMPVGQEIFDVCWEAGKIAQVWGGVERIFRKDIKLHFCQSYRAKDSNIRQALIDRFGPPGTKKAPGLTYGLKRDMWSAFAIAVYYWDIHQGR